MIISPWLHFVSGSSGVVTVLAPPEYTEYDVSTFSNSGSRQNLTDNNKYSLCSEYPSYHNNEDTIQTLYSCLLLQKEQATPDKT